MTGKLLWQQIKDVVDADRQIIAHEKDIQSTQEAFNKDHSTLERQDITINEKKQQLLNAQKTAKLNELTLQELKEKEDRKRNQLDSAQGQKEYKALEREIWASSTARLELEELVVKQLYQVDVLSKEYNALSGGREAQAAQLTHDMQIKTEIIEKLKNDLVTAHKARATAYANLPAQWQAQYERMRHSVQDPMVPVLSSSCSACYYSIPHHDLATIKKGGVILCRSCYRFLYHDGDAQTIANKATY